MTAPETLPPTTRTRPVLVTIAVGAWLVVAVVNVVASMARALVAIASGADLPVGTIVQAVVALALWALFAWGALRLAKGSSRARFWLAVFGALGFLGAVAPPYGLGTVNGVLLGAAAVLPYLPASRPFFPRTVRAAKSAGPRTLGWDPETGEPIRERP
jgi:hypothetical protein